jgi:hypothetical protein
MKYTRIKCTCGLAFHIEAMKEHLKLYAVHVGTSDVFEWPADIGFQRHKI